MISCVCYNDAYYTRYYMNCIKIELADKYDFPPRAIGEPADFTDKYIKAFYDDGSVSLKEIAVNMINDSDLQTTKPERRVVLRYEGKKLPITLKVLPISLVGIEAELVKGVVISEGTPADKSFFVVTAQYDDGSKRVVNNYKFFPYTSLSESDHTITIKYGRFSVDLPIAVCSNKNQNITEFDEDVVIESSDEETDDLFGVSPVANSSEKVTPEKSLVIDEKAEVDDVYDSLQKANSEQPIEDDRNTTTQDTLSAPQMPDNFSEDEIVRLTTEKLSDRELIGIYINGQPKTEYYDGDLFDIASLEVRALYSDEYEEVVTATVSPDGPLTLGVGHVVVSYKDKSAIILIHVIEKPPVIEVQKAEVNKDTSVLNIERQNSAPQVENIMPDWGSSSDSPNDSKKCQQNTETADDLDNKSLKNNDFYPSTIELRFSGDISLFL